MTSVPAPTMDLLARVTFTLAILSSVYFIRRANSDPNPSPPPKTNTFQKKDFLMTAGNQVTMRRHINFITAVGLAHAVLAGLPEPQRPSMCPAYNDPTSVDSGLFNWNNYTATVLTILTTAGLLRLAAYANLGASFTFNITKPSSGLKTTGVHRYVRHPSYSAIMVIAVAMVMLLFRDGGLMGCWFPAQFARIIDKAALVWAFVVSPTLFWARVTQEEEFLIKTFGLEYVEYSARTKRFIPFVF
ncbi:hypothetical protein BDW74DRAFT_162755 [Aspergillus multicolor]|uniref:methyltransferase family protein n=1 Tax=Aspergillus multicolor TaxID=41759 RepID=UPI003CCCAC51